MPATAWPILMFVQLDNRYFYGAPPCTAPLDLRSARWFANIAATQSGDFTRKMREET